MNIYTKFTQYILTSLKSQRKINLQETDLRYISHEIKRMKAKVEKADEPGWLIITLD